LEEASYLSPSVIHFEPKLALLAENNGLKFYETIAREGKKILKLNGRCMVEIGHQQKNSVEEIFSNLGWKLVQVCKDLSGKSRVMVFSL